MWPLNTWNVADATVLESAVRLYRSNLFLFESQKIWWKIEPLSLGYSEQENAHLLIIQTQNYIQFQGLPSEESIKAACTSGASQNTTWRQLSPRDQYLAELVLCPLSLDLYHLYSVGTHLNGEETLDQSLSQSLIFLGVKRDLSAGCITHFYLYPDHCPSYTSIRVSLLQFLATCLSCPLRH